MFGPTKPKSRETGESEELPPWLTPYNYLQGEHAPLSSDPYHYSSSCSPHLEREKPKPPRIPSQLFEWREIRHRRHRALLDGRRRLAFLFKRKRNTTACEAVAMEVEDCVGNGGIFSRGSSPTENASTGRDRCRSTTMPLATPRISTRVSARASMDLLAGLYKLARVWI